MVAPIRYGHTDALRTLLEELALDPAGNAAVPFGRLPNVHFARFFIMDAAYDLHAKYLEPRLVFLADVDGSTGAFLRDLVDVVGSGLDCIFEHCDGYQGNRLDFLTAHHIEAAATYVNTRGRTVSQIKQEAALREAIESFMDGAEWRSKDPRQVRSAIQEFVHRDPSLAWARTPPAQPDPLYVLREKLHFAAVIGAALVLLPVIAAGLPLWVYFLRQHEKADRAGDVIPSDALVQALAAQEDHGIQNPFTSAGFVKPGPFRRFTGTLVLYGTNFLTRHVFNHANLLGVKTIHFARWLFLDDKRRVIFCSNYDGSLESYMDDFIDKIAWGLNAAFSNGVDYPKTNWLILDGANDEQTFKRFNLTHQLVAPFWYAAYQGLTALNIENNEQIRAGLYGDLDDAAVRAWLRRL